VIVGYARQSSNKGRDGTGFGMLHDTYSRMWHRNLRNKGEYIFGPS
jgi:hypothetical protein